MARNAVRIDCAGCGHVDNIPQKKKPECVGSPAYTATVLCCLTKLCPQFFLKGGDQFLHDPVNLGILQRSFVVPQDKADSI